MSAAQRVREKERSTTKGRLRGLRRLRKANPEDDDLWAEEFELRKTHQRVVYEEGALYVEKGPGNRANSNRTDKVMNLALVALVSIWERGTGQSITKTADPDDGQPMDDFFWWAEDVLRGWSLKTTARALLNRY